MKNVVQWLGLGILAAAVGGGCVSEPPPNMHVPIDPNQPTYTYYSADRPKPLPDQAGSEPPTPLFDDPPLVDQPLPEEAWFVSTYVRVGRPRLAIFVNRTLDGYLVGAGDSNPAYLRPGQYDQAALQSLDYLEMESLLTNWFHANGQVTLISPGSLRTSLTPQQIQDLQSGRSTGLSDVSPIADVLIQVQAHPSYRQNQLVVLLVGEAMNVRGGESIAQASVEMPAPVDRPGMNSYTRFLVRKMMHDMVGTWTGAPPPSGGPPASLPPATGGATGNATTPQGTRSPASTANPNDPSVSHKVSTQLP